MIGALLCKIYESYLEWDKTLTTEMESCPSTQIRDSTEHCSRSRLK